MNEQLDPQNESHELAHRSADEILDRHHKEHIEADEHRGWPGDGSGEDDFADMNQNEAMDYCNE